MKKNYNSKGFTLVELLAVIVIIGILLAVSITAVVHFIDRAKDEQRSNQEKTLAMAAENYLQDNRGQLPKSIGETTTIPISVLKNNKYITENIKNANGKSCMEKSYVTAYKESKTKYIYKAHLYCGDEEVPEDEVKVKPTIKIDFIDAEGNSVKNDSSVSEKVAEARFIIEFGGGKKDDKKIAIDGYSYSILTKSSGESSLKEVYSSGTLSANRATDIVVNRDNNLKDYIDISGETTVAIKATVRNVDGGLNDKIEFIGEDPSASTTYKDNTPPTCVTSQTKGEADEDDWININSTSKERKITVVCKDGSGSGCVRSTFTKTWNGSESHEYDTIQISDNAGNKTNCKVRVNIDVGYPVIDLEAYASDADGNITGSNKLTGNSSTSSSSDGTATVRATDYDDLVNGYMNKGNFPKGVIYKVTIKDTVSLKNWKWEVNQKNIKSTTANNYETVGEVEEAKTGSCTGEKECSFNVALTAEGLRKGKLTVTDKAGNKAVYTIYANIDRTGPTKPTIVNSSNNTATGDWTKENVTLTLGSTDDLAGMGRYQYTYSTNPDGSGSDANTQWATFSNGYGQTSFTTKPWKNEINSTTYIRSCDVAGNCSAKNSTDIKIDRTAPTGLKVEGYIRNGNVSATSGDGLATLSNNTWINGYAIVIPSNAADSGAGGVYYLLTTTGANENVTDIKRTYRNVDAQGESTISFKACDKLDNCSSPKNFKVKLDRTAPAKPVIDNPTNGEWTKNNVILDITANDSLSGLGTHYYTYNANATTSTGKSKKYEDDDTLWVLLKEQLPDSDGNGVNTKTFDSGAFTAERNQQVYIMSCDIVGNCSEKSSTWIRIDKTAPDYDNNLNTPGVKITNPTNGQFVNYNFKLTLESKDEQSGLKVYQYTYNSNYTGWMVAGSGANSNKITDEYSAERNQKSYVRACDNVGNCSEPAETWIRIDKTGPSCSTSKSNTGTTSGVTVKVTCSDPSANGNSGSGCEWSSKTYKNVTSSKSYTVYDILGNSGSCKVTVSKSDKCVKVLYPTVYSASYCKNSMGGVEWRGQHEIDGSGNCVYRASLNSDQGCCYYNKCYKVYN
jgi:prepilin-type N-terminal cleavage/methylation domain-containing protein